jgi:hypothetical protein
MTASVPQPKIAYCPKCNGEMGTMTSSCPNCGYDFSPERQIRRAGFANSRVADFVLTLGAIAAAIGSVFTAVASASAVLHGDLFAGLIGGPLILFFLLAAMVVFLRMQDRWRDH